MKQSNPTLVPTYFWETKMSGLSVYIMHGGTVADGRNLKDATLIGYYAPGQEWILEPLWNHKGRVTVLGDEQSKLWLFKAHSFPFDKFDIKPSVLGIEKSDDIWVEVL